MKANADTIAELDALLAKVREVPGLTKRQRLLLVREWARDAYTASKED